MVGQGYRHKRSRHAYKVESEGHSKCGCYSEPRPAVWLVPVEDSVRERGSGWVSKGFLIRHYTREDAQCTPEPESRSR